MRDKTIYSIMTNLSSFALPLIVGLFCIPITIRGMGIEKFGFLSVAWVVMGYFSVFDMGLGRALTQAIASRIGRNRKTEIRQLTKKTLLAMFALSVAGALGLAGISPVLIEHVLMPSGELVNEGTVALYILAVGVPSVVLYSGLKGVLEAFERFHLSAASRAILGIWTFVSPVIILEWTSDLRWIVTTLVIGRYFIDIILATLCRNMYINDELLRENDSVRMKEVLSFGGWITISNIISPIMVYMDRFFVSSIVGLDYVAYYTTPYDLVSRISFIPEAVFAVLFPKMTKAKYDESGVHVDIYIVSVKSMSIVMFIIVMFIVVVSERFLEVWIGRQFAVNGYVVMNILSAGLFVNTVARAAFNLVQAQGRSDLTAKMHMLELPIYIPILIFGIHTYGVTGAAIAWAARAFLDLVLLVICSRYLCGVRTQPVRVLIGCVALVCIILGAGFLPSVLKVILFIIATPSVVLYYWARVFNYGEKAAMRRVLHFGGSGEG